MKKRIISLLLVLTFILPVIPTLGITASAASDVISTESEAVITVEEIWGNPGKTVDLDLILTENPGILGATITISWDERLTLVADASGEAFNHMTYTSPSRYVSSGTNFVWFGNEVNEAIDGTILTLTFQVSETAQNNDILPVSVTYTLGDVIDENDNDVTLNITDGHIRVITYQPGDVTGDGRVNARDLVRLSQYISDGCKTDPEGYNAEVVADACDVNGDGRVNARDLIKLSQYISDGSQTNPDGYNAVLKPAKIPECAHSNVQETPAKAAECTEPGNIAYWYCSDCEKYFSDDECTVEISLVATIISATGHTEVVDEAVAPTYDNTGLTEGLHCSVCSEILLKQQIVQKLEPEYYSITYSNLQGATYPELTEYASHLGVSKENMPKPERTGYKFDGWFDEHDNEITYINAGTTENIKLTAKWTLETYTITYYCGNGVNSPNNILSYDVETSFTFVDATLKGCIFYRWVDQNGNPITKIEKGSIGNLILTAEYKEMRYTTVPISQIENPKYDNEVVFAKYDSANNLYTYVYYLGYVTDVPLTQSTGVTYSGVGDVVKGYQVTTATSSSVEKGFTNSQSYTISTEISSTITAKEEIEIPASKSSIEASITASLGTSETVSYEGSISKAVTKSEELSESFSFTIPDGSPYGYYRVTYMGTLDMFVAVVYDPARDKVDIVNYSVLRDTTNFAIDYSQSPEFDGHVVEKFDFVIPSKVQDHIQKLSYGSGGFIPRENGTECSIVGYTGTATDVVVPTYLNGLKVTSFESSLFAGNTSITSVTFGEGITSIPDSAFKGCTSLASVVFEGELTEIGANAFKGCAALEFEIPDTVTSIGDSAFDGCEAMDNVTISNTVTSLGTAVFNNCGDLSLIVNHNKLEVIQNAISSGATTIDVNWSDESGIDASCTLTVPTIQKFTFDGNEQTFNNLCIVSNAIDTSIKHITIKNTTGETALVFSSSNITLQDVDVESNKTALALSADCANLNIGATVKLQAKNGYDGLTANNLIASAVVGKAATFNVIGGAGSPGGCGMKIANTVTFNGYLTVNITGGAGNAGANGVTSGKCERGASGGDGSKGGTAISTIYIIVNDNVTLSITGGEGGKGGNGGNGWSAFSVGDSHGGHAGSGGNGGDAISADSITILAFGSVTAIGGTGGAGGTGGKGDQYGSDDANGGNGGNGGDGGCSYNSSCVIVDEVGKSNFNPGVAGIAGNGGAGDGSDGHNGSNGSAGTTGAR